ncbi:MAG: hypothetical protein CMM39_14945 [Rhodospirillaceae bacterium]|nr:hypothetical protein [Rhodospirillaceae bacterium]
MSLGAFVLYERATSGNIIDYLWVFSTGLSLTALILILLGRLTFIPLRIYRVKKTSFNLRLLNIIILLVVLSLVTTVFIDQAHLFDHNEWPSLSI